MQIFDSHCHYNMSPLYEQWRDHWHTAQEHGVVGALVIGTTIETSKRAVEIAQQEEQLHAVVGVHPHEYNHVSRADLPTLLMSHQSVLQMLIGQGQVVGIGETGLDYFRVPQEQRAAIAYNQQQALRMHIHLANEFSLSLILHVRDDGEQAYEDVLKIVHDEYQSRKPFILHCVSGPTHYLKEALAMGAYVGVAGNVTYPSADHIRDLVRMVPADRLLSETDAPFLPPQSHRGQQCEPWMIAETVEFLGNELQRDAAQLVANGQALG